MSDRHDSLLPGTRLRARGAASNAAGRYEARQRVAFEDGWQPPEERLVETEVRLEAAKSALTFNRSPDLPFDRSINPYRGCEHGCAYCFARPSHAWLNLSPGLDFETRLIARPGIGAVLERELRAVGYRVAPVAIGTNTDPYQPCEAEHRVTREVLEVLSAFRHPVALTTRGTLIERDLDLLAPMAAAGLLRVG
ncbi:MAG: radical SAM protein, partial [Anaerolineae bacterium]|nr:radical SAM protein [Anaerolineae bacterium]